MLSIDEVLQMQSMATAQVVAGRGGLGREVQWVHMVDIPDMAEWVRRGELLFTTAFSLKDNPALQTTLIPELTLAGAVGMVIAVGHYFYDIPEAMIRQADELDFPLLILPWEVPFIEVTRAISERILQDRYGLVQQSLEIHNTLTKVVLEGGDLSALAQALVGLVNCPVTIEDPSFRLLAYATCGEVDRARRESISWRGTPPGMLDELQRRGLLQRIEQSLHPIQLPAVPELGLAFERIVAPIIAGGERLGYVWLIAQDRLTGELDLVTIEHAATVAALILLRQRAVFEAEQRFQSSLLDDLLHSRGHLPAELAERAQALGLKSPVQVLIVRRRAPNRASLLVLSSLVSEQLRSAHRRGMVIERLQRLAVLLQDGQAADGLAFAQQLWAAARDAGYRVWVGLGRVAPDLDQVRDSYEEALEAVDVAVAVENQQGGVLTFADLGMLSWLRHLPPEVRARNRYYRAIVQLANYDAQRNTAYLATLEAYLDAGGNGQRTVQHLYLHRNTLRQRLRKIESLIDVDLADPNHLLNLHVALKALRLGRPS
jgi:purine catabolism regulator